MVQSRLPQFSARRQRRQRGMTLVEVLVSLVIFALGMLGAGGLIVASLRSGQLSANASVANGLARDYGEIMQLIPASVVSTAAGTGSASFVIDTDSLGNAPTDCKASSGCSAADMIQFNTYEWAKRVKAALPVGRAKVCLDNSPTDGDEYSWSCDAAGKLMVAKFGWAAKMGAAGTGDDILRADRPRLVVTLFGNQTDFVSP